MELQERSPAEQVAGVPNQYCLCCKRHCVCFELKHSCTLLLLLAVDGPQLHMYGSCSPYVYRVSLHCQALWPACSFCTCANALSCNCYSSRMQGSDGPEAAQAVARQELQLTQATLGRNPKSYGSWHHRKWVIQMRLVSLDDELKLVKQ